MIKMGDMDPLDRRRLYELYHDRDDLVARDFFYVCNRCERTHVVNTPGYIKPGGGVLVRMRRHDAIGYS